MSGFQGCLECDVHDEKSACLLCTPFPLNVLDGNSQIVAFAQYFLYLHAGQVLPACVFAVEKQFQCPSCFFEGKGKDLKFVSEVDQYCFSVDVHTQSKCSLSMDCKDLYGCMGNVRDAQL